ncbi:MAG: hypothetical protein LQ338_007279 [Usnochroma carphineum]|nr:MAG: hypothetical protein LQ338_007279 [Usnochroma carphineum]
MSTSTPLGSCFANLVDELFTPNPAAAHLVKALVDACQSARHQSMLHGMHFAVLK